MQIVIDIPDEEYNECKMQVELMKQEGIIIESLNTALRIFVANGIPLPKGHGRLIDAEVFTNNVIKYSHQSTKTIGQALADTPTIIEADIESEDKK